MHTRRLASFFVGAWILGLILVFFVSHATVHQADQIMASPPGSVARDIEELGTDATRVLLRYQASETNRTFTEIWSILGIGLAAAFLSATVLTAHRSRFLVSIAVAMVLLAVIQGWWLAPNIKQLGRTIDFLPDTANSPQRESHTTYQTWYSILGVVNVLLGVAASVRLMFDRYGWRDRPQPLSADNHSHHHGRRRRRKRTSDGSVVESEGPVEPIEAVDEIDHAHDGHVDR